jgi:copper chaperone CopZ
MAAMKAAILFAVLCVSCGSAAASAAQRTPVPPAPIAAIAPQGTELRIDIIELTCHSCAGQVANGTSRIPGVLHVSAEMLAHVLIVRYDATLLTEPALIAAIDTVVDSVVY